MPQKFKHFPPIGEFSGVRWSRQIQESTGVLHHSAFEREQRAERVEKLRMFVDLGFTIDDAIKEIDKPARG